MGRSLMYLLRNKVFGSKRIKFLMIMLSVIAIKYYNTKTTESFTAVNRGLTTTTMYKDVTNERVPVIHRMNGHEAKPRIEHLDDGKYRCILKHGCETVDGADMSLFSEVDVHYYVQPPSKGPQDLWAFYSKEPQIIIRYAKAQTHWDGVFNYSATFDRNTEASYHIFRAKLIPILPPTSHFFSPKPNMRKPRALWFVSHCTRGRHNQMRIFSARETFALQLSRYFTVDIYTSPDKQDCEKKLGKLIKSNYTTEPVMEDYAFYLSFESNLCKDYITEKFWRVLESNSTTIPVALGGLSIEDYEAVAPPNSFIHVRNFTSPEALANHLKFVAQNDNAFHYYNQWRNEYWLKTRHVYHKEEGTYYCDFFEYFCRLIYEKPNRVWNTFSSDFSPRQCKDVSRRSVYCSYYNFTCAHDK